MGPVDYPPGEVALQTEIWTLFDKAFSMVIFELSYDV